MNLIGDVKGKVAVMLDDMIDTAGESFKMLTTCTVSKLTLFFCVTFRNYF